MKLLYHNAFVGFLMVRLGCSEYTQGVFYPQNCSKPLCLLRKNKYNIYNKTTNEHLQASVSYSAAKTSKWARMANNPIKKMEQKNFFEQRLHVSRFFFVILRLN